MKKRIFIPVSVGFAFLNIFFGGLTIAILASFILWLMGKIPGVEPITAPFVVLAIIFLLYTSIRFLLCFKIHLRQNDIITFGDGLPKFEKIQYRCTVNYKDIQSIAIVASEKNSKNQSNNTSADELIYLIKTFSTLSNEIKYSDNERILLEVMFIKLCTPSAEKSYDGLLARISAIERAVKDGIKVSATVETPVSKPVKKTKTAPKPKAESEDFKRLRNMWLDFCENFKMPLRGILLKSELRQKDSDTVYISCEKPFEMDMVKNNLNIIKDILDEKTGKEFEIATITESEYKRWHDITYGVEESQSPEDEDWESLMSNVFPDADFL